MYETFRSVVQFRELELDPVERRLRSAVNVDDLRRIAKRRLPRGENGKLPREALVTLANRLSGKS